MRARHRVMHGQAGLTRRLIFVLFKRYGSVSHSLVARMFMQKPPLDPDVADTAPADTVLTRYDEEHIITYLRPLDAEGADWQEITRIVLHIDPEREPDRARRAFDPISPEPNSHLTRAKWMTEHGYRHLLRGGVSSLN